MAVLFVGRFQPLHNGHLSIIEQHDDLVIAVGSSQYSRTAENPLSFEERKRCLAEVTQAPVVAIPDIHDDAHWVEHLLKIVYTVKPSIDYVISGNPLVQRLCREAGLRVEPIQPTIEVSATQIRQWIRQHNPVWKDYVPTAIQSFIEPIIASTGSTEAEA